MPEVQHVNTTSGAIPYKSLFSTVSIVPPNSSLAFISTQWAADAKTGELVEGIEGDYFKQAAVIWTHIVGILKELGADMKDVVHKTVSFKDFTDDIGKQSTEGALSVVPDEWKASMFSSALTFNGQAHFHRPGIVYSIDVVVAVPNK